MSPDRTSSEGQQDERLRVLILTYFYPPMGGAGVQRSLKFSRYLPESGVRPTIVSGLSDAYPRDEALLGEIPSDTPVSRIRHTPFASRVLSARRLFRGRPSSQLRRDTARPEGTLAASPWRDRALSAITALQYPDDRAGWAREARRVGERLVARRAIDLVFSSSPPVSAHWAARPLAARYGLPWVADVRDMWTGNPAYLAPRWRLRLDERLERRLFRSADGIVAVTSSFAAELRRIAGPSVPVIHIPNGYDEGDFAGLEARSRERGRFRIVHAGTLYGQRSPEPILDAIERLLATVPELRPSLRLRLVGETGSRFDALLERFAEREPGVLERTGYVSHTQSLIELLSADALLLLNGGGQAAAGVVPGKVYEYLRAAKPILVAGPVESESADIVRAAGAGEVVDGANVGGMAGILGRWATGGTTPKPDPLRAVAYERRELTRRLASFLIEVHASHNAREGGGVRRRSDAD